MKTIKVIKREFAFRGKAWNLTMKNNPSFILGNGILTHNTNPAQDALRRMMESYGNITRFILSCNNVNKIIEPIQSRCETFHFSPLSSKDIALRVKQVSNIEKITIDDEAIILLSERAEGDMRKALNKLQVLSSYGIPIDKKVLLNEKTVFDNFNNVLMSLKNGRFMEARKNCQDFLLEGYTERDIIQGLHKNFVQETDLSYQVKGECVLQLAETDYRLSQGVSKGLQLDSCMLKIIKILKK